jgi:formamidopyrimidine-DNA glycosylase
MPELPEVEVTRLSFADRIAGARIESVTLGKPLRSRRTDGEAFRREKPSLALRTSLI